MRRKLATKGSGWAIYIQKDILKLLEINPDTDQMIFHVEYKTLKIEKIQEQNTENIENAMIRKFLKSGTGVALYVSNSILRLLEINPETDEIEYAVNNKILEIRKA
jgi:hypothetical protein